MNEFKKKNNLVCQNCGIRGHHIKECTQPTISLGIILYNKTIESKLKYLFSMQEKYYWICRIYKRPLCCFRYGVYSKII